MYSIKERVRYSETDKTGHLTLTGIVNYFQDCSNFQSEELGVGMKFLDEHHHGWILSAWQIIVERYPKLCEEIEVGTWPTAFNGLYGTRNFVMNDKHGKCVAYANSIWVFMDTERKRPAKPSKEDIEKYETEPELQMEYAPRKIVLPETWEEKEPFSVQKSDIDTNGHGNIGEVIGLIFNGCKNVVVYTCTYTVIEFFTHHSSYSQIGVDFISSYPVV